MVRLLSRAAAAAAVVALSAPAIASFDVSVDFRFELWNYDNGTPSYNLFPQISVSNFTDPFDAGNTWQLLSPNGQFEGTPNGSSSTGMPTIAEVIDEANAGAWQLTITDGATATVRTFDFSVSVDSAMDNAEYFRLVTITNYLTDAIIPATPTFEWAIDPTMDPFAEYDQITPILFGDAFDYSFLGPSETDWTPGIAPLAAGTYSFAVTYSNTQNIPLALFSSDFPSPTDGGDDLDSYNDSFGVGSLAALSGLTVVPAPGTLALAGLGGIVGLRRRR